MKHRLALVALTALFAASLVAATTETKAKPAKPLHISRGETVKLAEYAVAGKTTVFDFYSEYCGPCVRMTPALEKLHATRPDVVVVKVDINRPGMKGIDWKSPVAKQFNLNSIPHFKLYGPDGKMIAEDGANSQKAREMVTAMLN